jgi:oligosaccharide repeat unit polymerase
MEAVVGYKFELRDLDVIEYYYLAGYTSILLGGAAFSGVKFALGNAMQGSVVSRGQAQETSKMTQHALYGLATASFLSMMLYTLQHGITFGSRGYESRYEDAAGNGIFLILFPTFLPLMAFGLSNAKSKSVYVSYSLIALLWAFWTFLILNGYRQILIATILLIAIVAIKRKYLSSRSILALGCTVLPAFVVGLSFLRYVGEASNSPFASNMQAAFYYIQGDLFPVDAVLKSYWYCNYVNCPGSSVIYNHLLRFIPRAIWTDKPDFMLDAAGYYTRAVVGYERNVTLSPTIVGEAILAGGWNTFLIITFAAGFITQLCTAWLNRSVGVFKYLLLANVYMGFFWVREGFSNGIYRIIAIFLFYAMGVILAPFVGSILEVLRPPTKPRLKESPAKQRS